MTYYYDDFIAKEYGKIEGRDWYDGTYITPDGNLFDVNTYTRVAHAGGFIIPFFTCYMTPEENDILFSPKENYLHNLIDWEKALTTRTYDIKKKAQNMKLHLVRYLINVYKSSLGIWDRENGIADFSQVTEINNTDKDLFGRNRLLKDILVQACNYDSIESQLYRTITTSKFNIYETFYDYILHDYKIYQIPKKVYDEHQERYIDWQQSPFMISDKELRLKKELETIYKNVPLEERKQYCRSKVKIDRFDFWN